MLTFGTTASACSAKSATYSVLTHFHADTTSPEAWFLHGHVPPGADPHGNTKDAGLVDDLGRRQSRRLAEGDDPHSKLPRLLELKPTTGKHWYRPDMTAQHHAVTVRDWEKRAPLSFRAQTAARGRAGSRATFAAQLARARQQWLLVEPCVHEPLMITPLSHDEDPRGISSGLRRRAGRMGAMGLRCSNSRKNEAKRVRRRRQRDDLDAERTTWVGG